MPVNPSNLSALRAAIRNNEITGNFLPSVFIVEPVSRCNLSCVMCPNSRMDHANWGDIDVSAFESIIIEIAPYAEFLMLYWMGETLLHPKIVEVLSVARKHISGKIVVSTNMTIGGPHILMSLLENCDIIICSLDRWQKRPYERIRRGAHFESVVANIQALLTMKNSANSPCEVIVKALDLDQKSNEYLDFTDFWMRRGARPMLAWLNDWAGTFPDMRNAAQLAVPRSELTRTACSDLWFKMVINWQGKVQMCCFDWNYENAVGAATIERGWLAKVWHGPEIVALRKMHTTRNYTRNKLCESCTTWGEPREHEAYINWSDESYFIVF